MIETNHKKIHHKMKEKGWDKHYITKTLNILKKGVKNKPEKIKKLENKIFWGFLLLMIIGNATIFIGIMPVVIQAPNYLTYITIFILGLCFGFFIDYTFRHIDINHKHYLLSGIIIPIFSLISLTLIMEFTKDKIADVGLFISINTLLLLLFYTIGYSLPHIIYKVNEKWNHK